MTGRLIRELGKERILLQLVITAEILRCRHHIKAEWQTSIFHIETLDVIVGLLFSLFKIQDNQLVLHHITVALCHEDIGQIEVIRFVEFLHPVHGLLKEADGQLGLVAVGKHLAKIEVANHHAIRRLHLYRLLRHLPCLQQRLIVLVVLRIGRHHHRPHVEIGFHVTVFPGQFASSGTQFDGLAKTVLSGEVVKLQVAAKIDDAPVIAGLGLLPKRVDGGCGIGRKSLLQQLPIPILDLLRNLFLQGGFSMDIHRPESEQGHSHPFAPEQTGYLLHHTHHLLSP